MYPEKEVEAARGLIRKVPGEILLCLGRYGAAVVLPFDIQVLIATASLAQRVAGHVLRTSVFAVAAFALLEND